MKWLNAKLEKLFPKHELESARLAKQREALEGYERGFCSESSSSAPTEYSNPDDAVSETLSSEESGKILLLKYPNTGDKAKIVREQLWDEVDEVIKISSAIEYVDDGRRRLARKVRELYRNHMVRVAAGTSQGFRGGINNAGPGASKSANKVGSSISHATSGVTHGNIASLGHDSAGGPSSQAAGAYTAPISPRMPASASSRAPAADGANRV
ncbi:hypothetical protein TSOC_003153 [Tetrabaena socialis]|uniref:Uncharacterized protein n=1 Tax=Tetrabaena socialis TaxID=47790 RepID=A0A2J8AC88_9CHLO|nr:hypothetical protein TSOC_003153 [Tetrabaena socialis]|eukprot:PNH10135.1 hypothetical protein TSOC_003153 [Tetrabaena socialis]